MNEDRAWPRRFDDAVPLRRALPVLSPNDVA
jgi:hypothetical protein